MGKKRARAENCCKEEERPHPLLLKEHIQGQVLPSSHSRDMRHSATCP